MYVYIELYINIFVLNVDRKSFLFCLTEFYILIILFYVNIYYLLFLKNIKFDSISYLEYNNEIIVSCTHGFLDFKSGWVIK